jgi:hypothetical protein
VLLKTISISFWQERSSPRVSLAHGSCNKNHRLGDSGQGDKGSVVDSTSDSAWSDFSAISATDFNHGQLMAHMAQLLSILKTIQAEHRTSLMLLELTARQHEIDKMLKAMQSRASSEGCGVPIEASNDTAQRTAGPQPRSPPF